MKVALKADQTYSCPVDRQKNMKCSLCGLQPGFERAAASIAGPRRSQGSHLHGQRIEGNKTGAARI